MSGNLLIDKLGFYAPIPDLTDLGADVNSQLNQMKMYGNIFSTKSVHYKNKQAEIKPMLYSYPLHEE